MKRPIMLLLLAGLMLGGLAQAAPAFKEGLQYTLISPPPPSHEGQGVEVIEFFWYGCPHCNSLEPYIKSWLANKADYIHFVRMPAPFSGRAMLHAKNMNLDTLDAMTAFLESQGVDGKKFREALDSFAVQTQLNRATVLARRYGIRSVPTLVVDGRYKSGKGFTGYGEFTELVDFLAAKTLKERQGAATTN